MPSCCLTSATCLAERQRAMRINGPYGWSIPCMDCVEGCARQMDCHKIEPDIEPHPLRGNGCAKPGPSASGACGRGHERAVYGRLQSGGRDAGTWACKECEKIRRAKRRAGV